MPRADKKSGEAARPAMAKLTRPGANLGRGPRLGPQKIKANRPSRCLLGSHRARHILEQREESDAIL
eukprot:9319357-Pyramimonas_sp.AAC.1